MDPRRVSPTRWLGLALLAGVVAAALHWTRPAAVIPVATSDVLLDPGATVRFPFSPPILGVGRYPLPAGPPPAVVPATTVLAGEQSSGAETVDYGGYTFQTLPSTYSLN
jgi:hypothetical protein